jgi:hypothetical protein
MLCDHKYKIYFAQSKLLKINKVYFIIISLLESNLFLTFFKKNYVYLSIFMNVEHYILTYIFCVYILYIFFKVI